MNHSESEKIEAFLRKNYETYIGMLETWVGANSFTSNREGVNQVGVLTAAPFLDLGFSLKRIPSANPGFGDHFVLARQGTTPETMGLISHLDTVFPADEERENAFAWRDEGERIYGPGTVDIKGGTMLVYMLLDAMREFEPDLFGQVTWKVLLDASEETMSEDFGEICKAELTGAKACLIFEGGFYEDQTYKVVQMRKGMAKYRIRVDGKAAHAGVAHADGANAIVQLADIVQQIAGFTNYSRGITFNVGSVEGGTVPNRVPHFATAVGEMRAFDKAVFEEGVNWLKSLEEAASVKSAAGISCRISVDIYEVTAPWPRNEATDHLVAIWQEQAEQIGARVFPEARGGLSDGNHTWDFVPTLDGLGPGGGNAHCSVQDPENGLEQEYIYTPSILPKAVLNFLAVRALLS